MQKMPADIIRQARKLQDGEIILTSADGGSLSNVSQDKVRFGPGFKAARERQLLNSKG